MLPFSAMTIRKSGIRGCLPVWGGDGHQISETLVRDNLDFPSEFWEQPSGKQLSEQEKRAIRAQMMEVLSQNGLDRIDRSYFYDDKGRVVRRQVQMGGFHQETITILQRAMRPGRCKVKAGHHRLMEHRNREILSLLNP